MQRYTGCFWIVIAFFMTLHAVDAQAPPVPTAGATFDGKYALVSATTVNEAYRTMSGRMGRCGDARNVEPLTIMNGEARYSANRRHQLEGTVGGAR